MMHREPTEEEKKQWHEMELARLNAENSVIESLEDLDGWTVVGLTRWKPGVVQYRAVKHGRQFEHIIGFAKDEVFKSVQLPT